MVDKIIHVKVYRGKPENSKGEGHYVEYEVPYHEGLSVLEILDYIYKYLDPSLSFYFSCRIGKCRGCYVDIDGQVALACITPARKNMTIGPHKKYEWVKDLMVDLS